MEVRSWPKLVIISPDNEIRHCVELSKVSRGTMMHLNWCEIAMKRRSGLPKGAIEEQSTSTLVCQKLMSMVGLDGHRRADKRNARGTASKSAGSLGQQLKTPSETEVRRGTGYKKEAKNQRLKVKWLNVSRK